MRIAQPANLLLLPVLAYHGRQVKRDTPRLPEAEGDEGIVSGRGHALRLLVMGDSMAAGVGVDHNDDALAGRLATSLASDTGRRVSWRVIARGGATARYASWNFTHRIHDPFTQWRPDIVVISIGINDLLRFRRLAEWERDIGLLVSDLYSRLGHGMPLVFTGLPPIAHFPALPRPLRTVLAVRARVMERSLRKVAERTGAVHVPMPVHLMKNQPAAFFARDRFHPSTRGYQELGRHLAPVVTRQLAPSSPP
jgi:lysophospholipase L1-like esterase